MKINEAPYIEEKSCPIINKIRGQGVQTYLSSITGYSRIHYEKYPKFSSKQMFKEVFGRQLTTINYTHRNWIWTFSSDDLKHTIFAMVATTGVAWEMNVDSDIFEIVKLKDSIIERLENGTETSNCCKKRPQDEERKTCGPGCTCKHGSPS